MKNINSKKHMSGDFIDAAFVVNGEMITDNGEDSFAYSVKEQSGFISVFDGCGGIGSRKYDEYDGKSGAYIASRVCANVVYKFFEDLPDDRKYLTSNTFTEICDNLKVAFHSKLMEFENSSKKSLIKGSLTKSFPTTASGIFFKYEQKRYSAFFTWAGDSRGFIMSPHGLTQITKDDITGSEDALSNLSSDGNLSNYISTDEKFVLNHKATTHDKHTILITATDGCFGYFSTPMEFEFMLLDTLINSSSINEWKEKLNEYILKYTGDDYTMGIVVLGFGSFKKLKRLFLKRHKTVFKRYIEKLNGASKNELHDMWRDYKKVYYRKYRSR